MKTKEKTLHKFVKTPEIGDIVKCYLSKNSNIYTYCKVEGVKIVNDNDVAILSPYKATALNDIDLFLERKFCNFIGTKYYLVYTYCKFLRNKIIVEKRKIKNVAI